MMTFAEKEAKTQFGLLLDTAQREPVLIQKQGHSVAVLTSAENYQRLEEIEDAWWAMRAEMAEKEGFIGLEASDKLISALLNAEIITRIVYKKGFYTRIVYNKGFYKRV